jgi:hypothetical protein
MIRQAAGPAWRRVVALVVAVCLYGLAVAGKRQARAAAGLGSLAFIAVCAAAAWTPTTTGAGAGLGPSHQPGPGRPTRSHRKVVDDLLRQLS